MYKIKIYGAGSIGNHFAHASRSLGWEVHVCDLDRSALERMQHQIYPERYGQWDDAISLFENSAAPRGDYDLIFIGTPPEYHLPLALDALQERPKALLVEKPLCLPDLTHAQELYTHAQAEAVHVFVGYNHVVGEATKILEARVGENFLGEIETIDVEFREHWGGIFKAHPWLSGPADTYLGYWQSGGGASGEHSHAINLWQYFAHIVGAGRVATVNATLDYVEQNGATYDKLCALNLTTDSGLIGRVIQDVVTQPAHKWGRLQGSCGYIEWYCNLKPNCDAVLWGRAPDESQKTLIHKTRPDDFIWELKHLQHFLSGKIAHSGIALEQGLDTMMVIAAAHLSAQNQRAVAIDYARGYVPEALSLI